MPITITEKQRLLIVEDDDGVATLERRHLERAGFQVERATSASETLELLREQPFDLILLDYRLPDTVDGLGLFTTIKEAGFDIPVILVTGHGDEAVVIRAFRTGVRDFVSKSSQYLDYLPEAVARVLRQVETERQLAISEKRFRTLADAAPVFIWMSDATGACTFLNRRWLEFRGRDFEDEKEFGWAEGVHPEDKARVLASLEAAHIQKVPFSIEYRMRHQDGSFRWIFDTGTPCFSPDGYLEGFLGSALDITERKRMEEQLLHSQRMEAVGQLAGGVAHDFNNLLTGILGFSQLMLSRVTDSTLRADIQQVYDLGERASVLTSQLLAFSRRRPLQTVVLNLGDLVDRTARMLQRIIGDHIDLRCSAKSPIGNILADPSQLEQVMVNLAVNARDAMPSGGKLTLDVSEVTVSREYSEHRQGAIAPGRHVILAVTDSGEGMDHETRMKVFEPFFTTKDVGKGTGLGLSIVYGIVKQHNGHIDLYTEQGKGSCFKIYFPVVDSPTPMAVLRQMESLPVGTESILIVDDEPSILAIAERALQKQGYRISSSTRGEAAIKKLQESKATIDLLITDVVMPGMSGVELYQALKVIYPRLRVLYMSGYTDGALIHQGVTEISDDFIEKPFDPKSLAIKVRQVMDRTSV